MRLNFRELIVNDGCIAPPILAIDPHVTACMVEMYQKDTSNDKTPLNFLIFTVHNLRDRYLIAYWCASKLCAIGFFIVLRDRNYDLKLHVSNTEFCLIVFHVVTFSLKIDWWLLFVVSWNNWTEKNKFRSIIGIFPLEILYYGKRMTKWSIWSAKVT